MTETIYDLLAVMRDRRAMYVSSLAELEVYLCGYEACLEIHGLVERDSGRPFRRREFGEWLCGSRGWSAAGGFSQAISDHVRDPEQAFEMFFDLVAEYRGTAT